MFELLDGLIDEKKRVDQLLREKGETALRDTMKQFFAAHPDLKGVMWRQYTPFFNDGDECVFRLGEVEFAIGDKDFTDTYSYSGKSWNSQTRNYDNGTSHPYYEDIKSLESKIHSLKDVLKASFGDHTKIVITSEEIEVTEYTDHD